MRRLGVVGILAVLVAVVGGAGASASGSHKLRSFEARSAAETAAYGFEHRHKLRSSAVGRCKRKARRRMLCLATATGESAREMTTCRMRIKVRAVHPGYWTERANVVWRRCRSEAKPYLTYDGALAAIQATGNAFAGVPTVVGRMNRRDDVTFAGTAEWVRASIPPSEYFPTEQCQVDLVATLQAGVVSVANDGFSCF